MKTNFCESHFWWVLFLPTKDITICKVTKYSNDKSLQYSIIGNEESFTVADFEFLKPIEDYL